jgi:hypothetical protein
MLPHNTIGGSEKPESHYVCIMYDQQTGRIHHIHQVINFPGAEAPSREEMEKNARLNAPKDAPTGLAVLLVPSQQLERGKSYRVDHAKQTLVVERDSRY